MKKILFRCFWCLTLLSFGAFASGGGSLSSLGFPAILLDNPPTGQLTSTEALDMADRYDEKTLAIAFITGPDVTTRQVIYEQGGGTRGFNIYIEANQLHMSSWSYAGGGMPSPYVWDQKVLSMNIAPLTPYSAVLALAGNEQVTGTMSGYLNGVPQGVAVGIGPLYIHSNGNGVGQTISKTVINDVEDLNPNPFVGSVKRITQFNQAVSVEDQVLLSQLVASVYDSQSPVYGVESPILYLENPITGPIANSLELNAGPSYMAKTLSITFTTSNDVSSQQVLFEQGGGWRGVNMYIENQQLHMAVYQVNGHDPAELWGYKRVSVNIAPNTEYNATLVMESQQDWTGTLTGYLNGVNVGVANGVGPLLKHENGIGVGDINDHTILNDLEVFGPKAFTGSLKHIAEFNQALSADDVVLLAQFSVGGTVEQPDPLSVDIATPETLVTVGYSPVQVTGAVSGDVSEFTLNGVPVTPASDGSFSAAVALTEGFNTIIARVTDSQGAQLTDSISVSLDLTPPYLTIDSHTSYQTVFTNTVTVTGLVNDIVRGTVEETQAVVDVNGVVATVANRSYAAKDVPLVEGENVLTITAVDQAGNSTAITQTIIYQVPSARNITVLAGQDQTAIIGAKTTDLLEVLVTDSDGQPVNDETVVFRVIQGAGVVGAESENYGRAVVATTDAQGIAKTLFQLGYRTGVANHKVRAQVVGYEPEVIFHASAESTLGDKISVNSGNNQRGIAGQNLPAPFVVAVTDSGANVVSGSRVRFDVISGDGSFGNDLDGNAITSIEKVTDSDGRATVQFTLGSLTGLDRQRVQATLIDAPVGDTLTAGFMATAFVAGDPGQTAITGAVVDNQDRAIPGVTIRVEGTDRTAVTDIEGRFTVQQVPVGPVHVIADGSTASVSGEFPTLSYHLVTVPGVENPLSAPIYMVKLDTENAVYAGPEDVSLTLPEFPGFQLDIAKDSITFPDGSREGLVSVTAVNASKVPMAPPNGMQPQFIVTIQPVGATFDPPARLSLPNVDGHAPGAQVEMYSFDHDLEEFVAIGLGTVSEDGSQVRSNVGVGVVKAGWHCGSQPGGSGTAHNCATCFKCQGGDCVKDEAQNDTPVGEQTEGDCKVNTCDGEKADESDAPTEDTIAGDCKKPGCDGSSPNQDGAIDDEDVPTTGDVVGDCKKPGCSDGEVVDVANDDDIPVDGDVVGDCKKPGCSGGEITEGVDLDDIKPEDVACKFCGIDGLLNKSDGTPIEGEPCKECQGGAIANLSGDIEGEPCIECQGGEKQNKPDGTPVPDDACMECKGGVTVKNYDDTLEQNIGQFIGNPGLSQVADKLNEALQYVGVSKSFELVPEADMVIRLKDCCTQDTGPITDGFRESEGTVQATLNFNGIPIWGPPTVSREIDFGPVIIQVDFEFGIIVDSNAFVRIFGGERTMLCEGVECYYAGTEGGFQLIPKAIAEAVVCAESLWTTKQCGGISVTPASFVIKFSGSFGYNLTCGEGWSGSLLLGEVIFQASIFLEGIPDAKGFTYTRVVFPGKTF